MLIQTNFRQPAVAPHSQIANVPALIAQSRPSPITLYEDDEVIYAQGEAAGPLYLVEFGAVRICRITADGRRQISAFHFAGEVFGFEADTEHHFYGEAVGGAGVRVLRPSSQEGMATSLLPVALRGLQRAQEHLLVLGRQNAIERMAAFLIDLVERQETDRFVDLPMQRNDIADYLGLTFETVSRILRRLKDMRIIRVPSTRQIEVLDFDRLEAFCE